MRVSKDQSEANRIALVEAAGRLFRARGIDGVGVAEVAKEAGLTHGALYAHFASKDALAAAALTAGLERSHRLMIEAAGEEAPTFSGYLDFLLSPNLRDAVEMGCPMTASASEIARQSAEVSKQFTVGMTSMITAIETVLGENMEPAQRRRIAITAIAAEIGAMMVARAVAKSDTALSDEVLDAVRTELDRLQPSVQT